MYEGFLRLGGTEIANANRTEAYVKNLLPGFPLKGCQGAPGIPRALGETYDSPLLDGAPWVDPNNPATYRFYGFYPVSIEGVDSSTISASVSESLSDGGFVNSPRATTREIRVRGVLVGEDELAVSAGMSWLNEALAQNGCDGSRDCNGGDLDFFAAEPTFEVCYDTGIGGGGPFTLDGLSPGDVVQIGLDSVGNDLRMSATINPILGWDGLTFSWGVSRWIGSVDNNLADPLFNYGPVTPYRTNRIRNPRFGVDTSFWGSSQPITRVATGGPDGGTFGRMTLAAGTNILQIDTVDALSGQNMLQFYARTSEPTFTVTIRSSVDFSVLSSQTFTGDTNWAEYSMVVPNASQTFLEYSVPASGAGTFDVSMVLLEAATQFFPYFDGSSVPQMIPSGYPDATSPEYATSWLGPAHKSASRMEWVGGPIGLEFCGEGYYAWLSVSSGFGSVGGGAGFSLPEPDEVLIAPFARYMRDVSRIDGPRVTRVFNTGTGAGRVVEFLLVAATPFAYVRMPYANKWNLDSGIYPATSFTDAPAPSEPPVVVIDPDCPPLVVPPRPPVVENSCVVTPGTWDRYVIPFVSADEVSRWSKMLPHFRIQTTDELRQLRIRTYRNPLGVRYTRTNFATLPYPNLDGSGGWDTLDPTKYATTQTASEVRRVGTVASKTVRTATGPSPALSILTYVGAGTSAAISIPDATFRQVTFSFYYRVFNSPNPRYRITVYWDDAAFVNVGLADGLFETIGDSSSWHRATFTSDFAPAGAVYARVMVEFLTETGSLSNGDEVVLMQDMQIEYGSVATPYFDGNGYRPLVDGTDGGPGNLVYSWVGAVGNSASVAEIDQYGFESEFIVSYMPADSTISVDSTVRRSEIFLTPTTPGVPSPGIPAANLVYGQDGGPMTWPEFTCGDAYILTVDVPPATDPAINIWMELTRREQ